MFTGSILIFLGALIGYVLGYFVRIITAANLSVQDYGTFYAVFSFFMILFVLRDFGTGDYLSKKISELYKDKKMSHIRRNILSILSFQTIFGVLIGGILFISADFLSQVLFNSPSASIIIRIMSILFIINLQPVINILQGFGHFKHFSLFASLRLLLVFIFLLIFPITLENISYAYVFSIFIVPVVFLWHIKGKNKLGKIKIKELFDNNYLKPAIAFGAFAFITNLGFNFSGIGDSLILSVDTILITYILGPFQAGIYQVASPLAKTIVLFGIAFGGIIYPSIASLWSSKNFSKSRKIVQDLYKYLLIILIPVSIFMIIFSRDIIGLLFGSKYLMAELSMQILSIAMVFYVFMFIGVFILNIIESSKTTSKFVLITIFINLILNILLIINFGISGAALATLISYMIGFVLVSEKISKKMNIKINNIFYIASLILLPTFLINFYFEGVKIYLFIFISIVYLGILLATKTIDKELIKMVKRYF